MPKVLIKNARDKVISIIYLDDEKYQNRELSVIQISNTAIIKDKNTDKVISYHSIPLYKRCFGLEISYE